MSRTKDWLADLKPGDFCIHNDSLGGMYEVMSLTHPAGDGYLTLQFHNMGHSSTRQESPFEFSKRLFNREFKVLFQGQDRQFSLLKALLKQAAARGATSQTHELMVRLEI